MTHWVRKGAGVWDEEWVHPRIRKKVRQRMYLNSPLVEVELGGRAVLVRREYSVVLLTVAGATLVQSTAPAWHLGKVPS